MNAVKLNNLRVSYLFPVIFSMYFLKGKATLLWSEKNVFFCIKIKVFSRKLLISSYFFNVLFEVQSKSTLIIWKCLFLYQNKRFSYTFTLLHVKVVFVQCTQNLLWSEENIFFLYQNKSFSNTFTFLHVKKKVCFKSLCPKEIKMWKKTCSSNQTGSHNVLIHNVKRVF